MPAPGRFRLAVLLEGAALLASLVVVSLVVFAGFFPSDVKTYPLEFLCLPLLLWAAFRFGRRMTGAVLVTLSTVAIWGTTQRYGPFSQGTTSEAFWLLQAYVVVMTVTALAVASAVRERRRAEEQLQALATTDPLTGLANYRRLLEVMRQEVARSRRTGRPFAVLLVDMNGLKGINDRLGHMAGSRAICRVADVLRRSCRETDLAARFGGDEFALVLSETADEGGRIVLDRICARLAADETTPALSVSGGHAVFPRDGDSPTLLLRAADSMLYAAKHKETTGTMGTTGTTGTKGTTGATGANGNDENARDRHEGHPAA